MSVHRKTGPTWASTVLRARSRTRAYLAILAYPGLTKQEFIERTGSSESSARKRLMELRDEGFIILDRQREGTRVITRAWPKPQPDESARAKLEALVATPLPPAMIREVNSA